MDFDRWNLIESDRLIDRLTDWLNDCARSVKRPEPGQTSEEAKERRGRRLTDWVVFVELKRRRRLSYIPSDLLGRRASRKGSLQKHREQQAGRQAVYERKSRREREGNGLAQEFAMRWGWGWGCGRLLLFRGNRAERSVDARMQLTHSWFSLAGRTDLKWLSTGGNPAPSLQWTWRRGLCRWPSCRVLAAAEVTSSERRESLRVMEASSLRLCFFS